MYLFNKHNWKFRRAWAKMQSKLIGFDITIKGEPNLKADMLVMNHQSLLDIVVMEAIYPKDIAWVAKKEIRDIPFFGQILSLPSMIILERENRKSLLKLIKDVKKEHDKGRPIGIFPEGTRSNGKEIRKFRMGAKLLSQKLNLKVQPILILNTREIVDSQNFLAKSGEVVVVYLDLIDPEKDENWYEEMQEKMRERFEKELKILQQKLQ
jgi:1-acyl-sn-glycerol-3-phosphate acyltransferase